MSGASRMQAGTCKACGGDHRWVTSWGHPLLLGVLRVATSPSQPHGLVATAVGGTNDRMLELGAGTNDLGGFHEVEVAHASGTPCVPSLLGGQPGAAGTSCGPHPQVQSSDL